MFWSDNNKSSIFKRKDENSDILSVERIWQIVHKGDLGKGEGLEFNIKLKDSLPNPINNTLWLVYNKNSLGNLCGVNKDAIKVKLQLEESNSYKGIINESSILVTSILHSYGDLKLTWNYIRMLKIALKY